MKKEKETTLNMSKKCVLFLSVFILIFPMLAFASTNETFEYYLVKFGRGIVILIIMFFLFTLINKNHIRKIKNNKKLFLFGIVPCLIIAVIVLVISIVGFLCVSETSLSPIMYFLNLINWTLGVLFIYSVLIVLTGIYFIFKKNKNMGYSFLKLGVSTFGACLVMYRIIVMISSGHTDYIADFI